ncbi:MAG: glycosyltransferase [Myxococcales bacterium]
MQAETRLCYMGLARVPATTKHVVFAMLHESGHLNPSFKLAKALIARGHRVSYLAIPDAEPLIAPQGIPTLPLWPDLFPAGFVAQEEKLSTLARRRAITRRYDELLRRLERRAGELFPSAPDLLVVDVTQPQFAFWGRRAGVPFLYLNTSLPQTHDRGVPPLRSGRSFHPEWSHKLQAELDWERFLLKRRVSAAAADLGGMCPPYDLARKRAKRFGVRRRELDWRTAYMPQLRDVLELGLCPPAFDFPRPAAPRRIAIASVDLERSERPFDWSAVPDDKPLIFCALGGQRYRPEDVPGFFARLVSMMTTHPDWHLLLCVGKHVAPSSLGALPDNVSVRESAPQLAVLRRARAMITHAGLGSVKECILNGVPMLAVPLDVDQPANAARVAYHGLGLLADVRDSTQEELSSKLRRLLTDRELQARMARMRERFLEVEQSDRGVEQVEAFFG